MTPTNQTESSVEIMESVMEGEESDVMIETPAGEDVE
jgi:hypothetical protein